MVPIRMQNSIFLKYGRHNHEHCEMILWSWREETRERESIHYVNLKTASRRFFF